MGQRGERVVYKRFSFNIFWCNWRFLSRNKGNNEIITFYLIGQLHHTFNPLTSNPNHPSLPSYFYASNKAQNLILFPKSRGSTPPLFYLIWGVFILVSDIFCSVLF